MPVPALPATLKLPGATLYYEVRGTGPLLILIPGGPADAGVFAGLADTLSDRYRVVAYDPRGNSRSVFDGAPEEQDLDAHGDDAAALIAALGGGPALVFGNSGGAQIGLNLAARHPASVRTLVAHEPPCVQLLPDAAQHVAANEAIADTYRTDGLGPARQKFMAMAGLQGGERPAAAASPPDPAAQALTARIGRNMEYFVGYGLKPLSSYLPDIAALKAGPARVVVGVGTTTTGQVANRSAVALAEKLGRPPVTFPGDHGGFGPHAIEFAKVLDGVLHDPPLN